MRPIFVKSELNSPLTFDMQIDTVSTVMEWMDFSATQSSWLSDTLIN